MRPGISTPRRGPDRRRQGRGGARRSAFLRGPRVVVAGAAKSAGPPNAGVSARRALGGNGPMNWRAFPRTHRLKVAGFARPPERPDDPLAGPGTRPPAGHG